MANIAGTYYSNQSYNPKFTYSISYSQTGRSATAVSYNFNVSFTKQNGWYGYDIIINWNIGGATGSKQIKSTSDVSSGSTSFSVTCSTNAAGGTLGAKIWTTSSTDSSHSQNAMNTGDQTVTKSTFNTAPSLSGNVTAAGSTGNKYIAENSKAIAVSWPAATDANNNLSGYRLRVSINGGSYVELTTTTSRSYSHNVANYGEGTTFKYVVDAYDSYSTWSGNIYSGTITKNTLSGASISTSSSIKYVSANTNISFSISGGSNTDGSGVSRTITCDGISVKNNSVSTGTVNVTVYVSGTTPTGPYINFSDVKNKFAGSSYKGTLVFKVNTSNNYGTVRNKSANVGVDLRTNPNAVSSCAISEGAGSTAYVATTGGTKYFIPKEGKVIQVTWAGGSGKLGEAIVYDLYVAYGTGGWQLVSSGISSSTKSYNHSVPAQTSLSAIKYLVRVKTGYGYYADNTTPQKQLHFYGGVSLTPGAMTRTATTCEAVVTVSSSTSIPSVSSTGTWSCKVKGTTTEVSKGTLGITQGAQTISVTGLTDSGLYDLVITYNDNTGFSTSKTTTLAIGANTPVFFINKYGIGVGGVKATSTFPLSVKGSLNIQDPSGTYKSGGIYTYTGDINGMGMAIQSGGTMVVGAGESPVNMITSLSAVTTENLYLTSDASVYIASNCQTFDSRKVAYYTATGQLHIPGAYYEQSNYGTGGTTYTRVYSPNNKPKLADIDRTLTTGSGSGLKFQGDGDYSLIYGEQAGTGHRLVLETADDGDGDVTVIRNRHYNDGLKDVAVFARTYTNINTALNVTGFANFTGGLQAGGRNVVSSGKANSGWYIRYHDGTQICWGGKSLGTCTFNNNRVNAVYTVEISGGLSTSGFAMTFAANFISAPYCTASIKSNGFTFCQAASADTTKIIGRAWASYNGTHEGVEYNYVAVGRWY